jgi:hypothetical protein
MEHQRCAVCHGGNKYRMQQYNMVARMQHHMQKRNMVANASHATAQHGGNKHRMQEFDLNDGHNYGGTQCLHSLDKPFAVTLCWRGQ